MSEEVKKQYRYSIKKIKDIFFCIDEEAFKPSTPIKFNINPIFKVSEETNLINFTLVLKVLYEETPDEGDALAEVRVKTIFNVKELNEFLREDSVVIPSDLLLSFVSISISHTRALAAKNLAGTFLQDVILPVINPVDFTKHYFSSFKDGQTTIMKTSEKVVQEPT